MAANWFSAAAPVARRVRAYFAPIDRVAQAPVLFNPADQGGFNLDDPPSPWMGLGWIQGFTRKATSKTVPVMTGIPAAVLGQVRESLDAQVRFQFVSWTKLNMALATGSQHMNILAHATCGTDSAEQTSVAAAVSILAGSTASSISIAAEDAATFAAGSIIAVDDDYTVVSQATSTGLILAEPLPGGAPVAGAKLQAVTGFVDREGGTFFQEWSALFVIEGSQGERIFFHYPRLQPIGIAEETAIPLAGKDQGGLERVLLEGRFIALPVIDPLDEERILCYRSFLPAAHAVV